MGCSGRTLALQALAGIKPQRVPFALFTWGFDYLWRVLNVAPWQLACGSRETWHQAHMALYRRHRPDILFYSGSGNEGEPTLLDDSDDHWLVQQPDGGLQAMMKNSYALYNPETKQEPSNADGEWSVEPFTTWGQPYVEGLTRLIEELGDEALVMPHHSPAYICACYALGFERAMESMVLEPEVFTAVCDGYQEGDEARMEQLAAAGAEAVFLADSWASCDVISPAMFERFALPYQQSIVASAHRAGLRAVLWNEGDIGPILQQEAGIPVDAFAFEQPRKHVTTTVADVRIVFGAKRCLFGNLDSEGLLLRNDPGEIRAAVEEQVEQSGPDAPFILCTGSPIPSDVEPTALDAVLAALKEV